MSGPRQKDGQVEASSVPGGKDVSDCVDGSVRLPTISFRLLFGLLILHHGRRSCGWA
jgi:hypothetical protein